MCPWRPGWSASGRAAIVVTCALLTWWPGPVAAQQTDQVTSEPKRPAFADRRFEEDWSGMKGEDLSSSGHVWDGVKFIPLDEAEHVWLTIAGQIRERYEYYREFQFGDSEPSRSDGYELSRVRLSLD